MPTWIQTILDWADGILSAINGALGDILETVLGSVDLFALAIPTFFVGALDIVLIIKVIKGVREFI